MRLLVSFRLLSMLAIALMLSACDFFMAEKLPSSSLGCDQSVVGVWQQDGVPALWITDYCKALYLVDAEKKQLERVPSALSFFRQRDQRFVALKDPDGERADADAFARAWVIVRYSTDDKQLRWSLGDVKAAAHEIIDGAISGSVRADRYQTRVLLGGDAKEIAFAMARRDYFSELGAPLVRANPAKTAEVQAWLSVSNP
jgi:hypothetical protein